MANKAEKLRGQITEKVASWPEEDLEILDGAVRQIEEWRSGEYEASDEELRVLDAALVEMEKGQFAPDEAIEAAFGKFRRHEA